MTFQDLNINKSLENALTDLELLEPTPIQSEVFSVVMSGKDVCGIAQTGTGKTIAYLLPLLRLWNYSKDKFPTILVVVPTRELVIQVCEQAKSLAKYINFDVVGVYGGVNLKPQVAEVLAGCDMIVCTPGRFIDLAAVAAVKVKNIKKVVIDEFDLMLDLGFSPQLKTIFDKIPSKRQSLLFSATKSEGVNELINTFFKNPELIEIAASGTPLDNISQKFYELANFNTKINFLELLLFQDFEISKAIVFVSEKSLASLVYDQLILRGLESVDIIHSNKSQNYRFNVIKEFEEGNIRILIATDIVARGIDITDVSHVICMDFSEEAETHIHRIGRTGRLDKKGASITFFSPKELEKKQAVEKLMNLKFEIEELPSFLEISDELLPFERDVLAMKIIEPKKSKKFEVGPAFHEKIEKNKKVDKRRDIEKERKLKYGKSYKKETK